jgi:phosphoribosylformylglycinamidine synthase
VVHPGGDAAVIRIKRSVNKGLPEKGVAMTLDCNSRFCLVDPREGTALSVAEAYRNICAVGATPIGISDCLNFGSPQRRDSMWQIAESVRGLGDAARAFEVPVISGNVSLNNETKGKPVLPTPQIAMVGLMPDASKAVRVHFKDDGDKVFVLGTTEPSDLGASEYLSVYAGLQKGRLPTLDYDIEIRNGETVRTLIEEGLLASCHDLSQGGLAAAVAEACFSPLGLRGVRVWPEAASTAQQMAPHAALFSETGGRYLVSVKPKNEKKFLELVGARGVPVSFSGVVGGEEIIVEGCARVRTQDAYERWSQGLSSLLGD